MLVLTRKQNETIQVGQDIVIKVISTAKGKVKIGIDAPEAVRVMRGELADEVKAKRLAPAVVAPAVVAPKQTAASPAAPLAGRLSQLRAAC